MVIKGPFQVALVRADTREPFQEHVNESKEIYAEVEPDMEYFIRVQCAHPEHLMVRADFVLDGASLGYCTNLVRGREELHGLWLIQGDSQINKALCFCIQDSGIGSDKRWIGSLEVVFSEAIPIGVRRTRDSKNQWTGGNYDGSISKTMKKIVKSKEGSLALVTANPHKKRRYRAGEELTRIKIHYCTAFGLIHAGLLPKPPLWDFHRARHPRQLFSAKKSTPSMTRCLNVTPRSKTLTPANTELGTQEVVVDYFDLVEADESSDEGGQPLVKRRLDFGEPTLEKISESSPTPRRTVDSAHVEMAASNPGEIPPKKRPRKNKS